MVGFGLAISGHFDFQFLQQSRDGLLRIASAAWCGGGQQQSMEDVCSLNHSFSLRLDRHNLEDFNTVLSGFR